MDELILGSDEVELVALPRAGGRLHRLVAFGHSVLRTPPDVATHLADPFFWGSYVMAPWCNRLDAGPMRVAERSLDLPANFPDGTAIHGQVYAGTWRSTGAGELTVRGGGDGWPWRYEVRQRLAVSDAEVQIRLSLVNLDRQPMPAGIGIHPWFAGPPLVAIHGRTVIADNLDPDAAPRPVGGRLDLRRLGPLADGIDASWLGLDDPAVDLVWPRRLRMTMRGDGRSLFVVAAHPPGLDAIAVEAQTHAPHGLRRLLEHRTGGLHLLLPGETLSLGVTLAFERLG